MLRKNETFIHRKLPEYTVTTVPDPIGMAGKQIYVTNGAAGQPIVAFSDGSVWRRSDTRDPISA